MEHKFQNQHRLPQVYLKKFGYSKEGDYYIRACKVGENIPSEILIKTFSTGINIFDLPFGEYNNRRAFENNCNKTENYYNSIIKTIDNNKCLTPRLQDALNHFVASIISRDKTFREDITSFINSSTDRSNMIDEITRLTNNKLELNYLMEKFVLKDINFIIGFVVNDLVFRLRNFKSVFLESPEDYSWLSCDSPVYRSDNSFSIMVETEIYFPLTKKYCLYMFHPNNSNAALRNFQWNKVRKIEVDLFHDIINKLYTNIDNSGRFEYLII